MTTGVPSGRDEAAELTAGLAALASFQAVTQQADAKANMLMAVQVGISAVVATQLREVRAGTMTPLCLAVTIVYVISFCLGGYALIQIMRPRTALYPLRNAFSLTASGQATVFVPAGDDKDPMSAHAGRRRSQEAWEAALAVSRIAARKNHHVSHAMWWTAVMVIAAIVWLAVVPVR
jgi:hypothetical protein